jgi:hypothetical protein
MQPVLTACSAAAGQLVWDGLQSDFRKQSRMKQPLWVVLVALSHTHLLERLAGAHMHFKVVELHGC